MAIKNPFRITGAGFLFLNSNFTPIPKLSMWEFTKNRTCNMLQGTYIRENKEEVVKRLAIRNFDAANIIERVLESDEKRKATQNDLDNTLAQINTISKQIGELFKSGKTGEANELKQPRKKRVQKQ